MVNTLVRREKRLTRWRWKEIKRNRYLYLLLLPGVIFYICFKYIPMGGIVIAFKDYNIFAGIGKSKWVGLYYFADLFTYAKFWQVLRNTFIISFLKIIFLFPVPIVLSLLLNEMRNQGYKRVLQTLLYLPHFLSWVVIGGIFLSLFSIEYGVARDVFEFFGAKPVNLLTSRRFIRPLLVITEGWKESGWRTIIYLAAFSQVDPNLYEAATMDGAGRIRKAVSISIPCISGVIVMLLILRIGNLLEAGFAQILVLQNSLTMDVTDIFDTYVLRIGLGRAEYSFATAVGLFQSVVAMLLIITANKISKWVSGEGLL